MSTESGDTARSGGTKESGPGTGSGVEREQDVVARAASVPAEWRSAAEHYFGDRLPLAVRYAELLATDGVARGLVGPREVPRMWDRHLLNSVALVELLPSPADGVRVADVGSGAGLPGLVLGVARPELDVVLVEPQLRRTRFLEEVVAELGLARVTVVRARAEEAVGRTGQVDVVVARAVAPLGRLAEWCLPLTKVGGRVLALKGASASAEIEEHRTAVRRAGGAEPVVTTCGAGHLDPPATVVEVVRERGTGDAPVGQARGGRHARRRAGRPSRR